jgi:ferredoxin
MNEDIYRKLQNRLDQYSIGFNATKTGREMTLLKILFTPEQAKMYLFLKPELAPVNVIAECAGMPEDQAEKLLEKMTRKGHTFPAEKEGKKFYAAAPFMHGIFENATSLYEHRPELQKLSAEIDGYLRGGFMAKGPSLRTIPVNMKQVNESVPIAPFDDVEKIVKSKEKIAVINCSCALKSNAVGRNCEQDLEVCIGFDFYAQYCVDHLKVGRYISQKEALEILQRTEDAGFVHQLAGDSRNTEGICNCCSDCCNILSVLKRLPEPAKYAQTNYFAQLETEACVNCETCIDRCPMGAISAGDETVSLELKRCIGCGLCVSTCPSNALKLIAKPDGGKREFIPGKYRFMRSTIDFENDMAKHI